MGVGLPTMRAASAIASVVGFLAAVFCFLGLAGASLPYQDPTPEMLSAQASSIRRWEAALAGSVVLGVGGLVGFVKSRRGRAVARPGDRTSR
jgi:hypothetical protein